jgi:4-amino-4-deoxy-L-arabinose transferase-like glycosyltransferase
LIVLTPVLEGWDSVDFALALDDYDIKRYQPHFPGYPVYIFLSWLCHVLVRDPVTAVILPGALLGSLTLVPLYALARRLFNARVALLTALLFVVNPACWLQAEKAFSDASGLFVVMTAAYVGWRACEADAKPYHWFLGSLLLGLGLGVRLSYAPLLLSWAGLWLYLYGQPAPRPASLSDGCYGLIVGVGLWLAPQLALSGGIELLHDGLAFTSGHFSQWGGTLVSSAMSQHQQWVYRVTMFTWGLLAYGLGFWWTDTSLLRILPSLVMLLALGLACRHPRWGKTTGFLLLYTLPYSLWILIGQHADQPRHLLPLIPVALMMLALGLERLRRLSTAAGGLACAILLLGLGVVSTRLVVVHRLTPPPRLQVLQYVTRHFESHSTRLYAWGTRRMFAFYAPMFDVRQRRDLAAAQQDLDGSRPRPAILLVTSDVQGVTTSPHTYLVQRFERDRYVHNPHWQVELYRWRPPEDAPLATTRK